jgi:hypothetical protein
MKDQKKLGQPEKIAGLKFKSCFKVWKIGSNGVLGKDRFSKAFITFILIVMCFCNQKSNVLVEDFDDFYRKFNTDSLFQLSRVKFPLPGLNTEEMSVLDSIYFWEMEDWKYVGLSKIDTSHFSHIIENHRGLVREEVKSKSFLGLVFRRKFEQIDGIWYLTSQEDINL